MASWRATARRTASWWLSRVSAASSDWMAVSQPRMVRSGTPREGAMAGERWPWQKRLQARSRRGAASWGAAGMLSPAGADVGLGDAGLGEIGDMGETSCGVMPNGVEVVPLVGFPARRPGVILTSDR